MVLDDDGVPITPQSRSDSGGSTPRANSPPKKSRYPRGEIDDRHLYSVSTAFMQDSILQEVNFSLSVFQAQMSNWLSQTEIPRNTF